jgi:hypothetical protein
VVSPESWSTPMTVHLGIGRYDDQRKYYSAVPCVADPNPHVFGPPGSGSISQRYGSGSGSFYHHANIVRKTFDSYYFVTLFDFLSLKNDVNVSSESNKQKFFLKISFLLAS